MKAFVTTILRQEELGLMVDTTGPDCYNTHIH